MFTLHKQSLNNMCMLKRLILIVFSLFIILPTSAFAEEDWSGYYNIDSAWDGQKSITNKQFEETMDALQARQKKKENKQREKAIRKVKGSSLTPETDAHNDNMINEQPDETLDEFQLLNVPVNFISNGEKIDCGYYQVIGEKKSDGVYLLLYQAHDLKAKIKAKETNDDFNEETIKFVKILPCNDHQMKIIFGSVDFNAYSYITYIEPESFFKTSE